MQLEASGTVSCYTLVELRCLSTMASVILSEVSIGQVETISCFCHDVGCYGLAPPVKMVV
jgi:hypothetical protein